MIVDGSVNWETTGPKPTAEGFDMEAREKSIYEWVRRCVVVPSQLNGT